MLTREEVGAYVVVELADDAVAAQPGQFYMLAAANGWGGGDAERPFLARAISALRARGDGRIAFMFEDVGPGTARLCALEPGEAVLVVGPLGRGFAPPAEGREALLVGGGVGIPPLALFAERFGGRALLGFRDARHAAGASLLPGAVVATDDGSVGQPGLVTELLERELAGDGGPGGAGVEVYACGPPAMLTAVQAIVARYEVPAQLCLEAPMACGFGSCFGCVVATRDGYKRVCVDGPVFAAAAFT